MHAGKDGDEHVDVVVDFDSGLGVGRPEDSADILHDVALEPDWEGEEEGVERRTIEAFAQQAGGRREHEAAVGGRRRELPDDRGASTHAQLAVQDQWVDAAFDEALGDRGEVFGPAGQDETVASRSGRGGDVVADACGPLLVLDNSAEGCLYVFDIVCCR